jgi:hypothetical protein
MNFKVGEKTWYGRPAAERNLDRHEDARSVQSCVGCGRFFLSWLETPYDEARCSPACGKVNRMPRKVKTMISDFNYHGERDFDV